ncbi:MAG: hypothetical protein ACJ786_38975, partial [Catenulispora sp.]
MPPRQPPQGVMQPPRRNGLKIGLAAAAVAAVGVGVAVGVAAMGGSGTPQTNPPVSSSSTTSTGPTRPVSSTPETPDSSTPDSPSSPDDSAPSSPDSLPAPDSDSTTPSESGGIKAGCAEASHHLDAFNAANPAANGGKDFQIKADRDLASNLAADARLATDPAVKAAIQSESDSWKKFADYYAKGDTKGMSNTIPETSKAIAAVNTACAG